MQALNVDMIAAKLQSISLRRRSDSKDISAAATETSSAKYEFSGQTDGGVVMVDLNSDVALPYPWEQLLDIRTGQIYYKNLNNGAKTTMDPRKFTASEDHYCSSPIYYYSSSEEDSSDEDEDEESQSDVNSLGNKSWNGDREEDQDIMISNTTTTAADDDDTSCSSGLSYVSSASPTSTTLSSAGCCGATSRKNASCGRGTGEVATLVIAGCKSCFMYLMVPKHTEICPRCNGDLLQLGRNGCV